MERCDRCGFVSDSLPARQVASALRAVAAQYRSRLVGLVQGSERGEPRPGPWTAHDHVIHVWGVLSGHRADLMEGGPSTGGRHPHTSFEHDDPAGAIETAAAALASLVERLGADDSRPDDHRPDAVRIGRDAVHELAHHLFAIARLVDDTPRSASG